MICDNGYVNALWQWLSQWSVTMAMLMGTMLVAELMSEVMTELMSDLAMHTILTYLHVWISIHRHAWETTEFLCTGFLVKKDQAIVSSRM